VLVFGTDVAKIGENWGAVVRPRQWEYEGDISPTRPFQLNYGLMHKQEAEIAHAYIAQTD